MVAAQLVMLLLCSAPLAGQAPEPQRPASVVETGAKADGAASPVRKVAAGAKTESSGSSMQLLKHPLSWLVAGAAGALVPLVLLVLPFFWSPLIGPWALPLLLLAVLWGGVTVGAGGALTWLLMAAFSDERSGFLWPVLLSMGIGAGGVALSALVAVVVALPLIALGAFWNWTSARPTQWWQLYVYPSAWFFNPFSGLASVVGVAVWTMGLIATALAGTLAAGFLYHQLGAPRDGDTIHLDYITGKDLRSAGKSDSGDGGGGSNNNRSTSSGGSSERTATVKDSDEAEKPRREGNKAPAGKPKASGNKSGSAGPKSNVVGASCRSDEECIGTCTTHKDFGGGMCTLACGSSADCPQGSKCVDVAGGICAVSCENNAECSAFSSDHICGSFYERNGGAARACQVR